jgi:hypothetical protein
VADAGIIPASAELPTLNFTHREGLVLTAHFVPTPYTAPVIGTYSGLLKPSLALPAPNGTLDAHDTNGLVVLQLSSTGAFTASITRGISSWRVAGFFDSRGDARFGAAWLKSLPLTRTSLPPLTLSLSITPGSSIAGNITENYRSEVTAVSDFTLQRAAFSRIAKVPAELADTSSRSYAITTTQSTTDPAFTIADYPQTQGTAKITLYADGRVITAGKLADSTAFTSSGLLAADHSWPCYVRLYSSKGSVSAELQFTAPETLITHTGVWFRPFIAKTTYPFGWPEGLDHAFILPTP